MGRTGTSSCAWGTGEDRCIRMSSANDDASNGGRPVTHSKKDCAQRIEIAPPIDRPLQESGLLGRAIEECSNDFLTGLGVSRLRTLCKSEIDNLGVSVEFQNDVFRVSGHDERDLGDGLRPEPPPMTWRSGPSESSDIGPCAIACDSASPTTSSITRKG